MAVQTTAAIERPRLTGRAAERLDLFESPTVLGASRQLALAADLLACLAEEHEGDRESLARRLRQVAGYLAARRGASSQAVPNALAQMLHGLTGMQYLPPDEFREWVIAQIRDYDQTAQRGMAMIAAAGTALAARATRVLVYDYSSSVAGILRALGEREHPPTVVLPEARTLEGGRRFVEDLETSLLCCELIPDAAIGSVVEACDLALIGAETVSAEGGCYNTTGSLLVAFACDYWRVPLYVASTLIKIDTRTLRGYRRPIPMLDGHHLDRLTSGLPSRSDDRLRVVSPDLDYVPPALLTGFITEAGVLPPAAIVTHAIRFAETQQDD
ncbi:MAG: hypothetical protein U0031_14075 [Thermomicrobiales bacterium]